MMHGYWGGPWGFGWMGGIFMVIFWVVMIVGIIWLVRYLISGKTCHVDHAAALLEILKQRYAKGDISKDEYETKKRELGV